MIGEIFHILADYDGNKLDGFFGAFIASENCRKTVTKSGRPPIAEFSDHPCDVNIREKKRTILTGCFIMHD